MVPEMSETSSHELHQTSKSNGSLWLQNFLKPAKPEIE